VEVNRRHPGDDFCSSADGDQAAFATPTAGGKNGGLNPPYQIRE
jgi:hypothetical protein